ncbi:hypothetical protein CCHR01_18058 [Colletotrichum chrysophilum]|uniref:Uncharacterized protein n=2 Tax=Colletotrichum chrysophilum TaxID=1836956 RepID=A0AAD9A1C3_9PEZI|nr:hypothetical protein CCHR01_18058 [Colletotrichum chrysophilum]
MLKMEMTEKIISPSTLEVKDWNIIMKNCNVMHGWYTDPQTHQIKMAPKPAFILRKGLNNSQTTDGGAIPNYCVNDGSKIDVIDVEEGVRESMVQNSFAKSSVDAKLNGGYSKVSIGMSANTLLQMQKGQEKGKTKSNKTLVGQYKLPRATLFLTPDDLEPTPQLMKELKKVEKDNTLVNIRKFQMTFGEFFAHEPIDAGGGYTRQESQDTDQSNSYGSRNDSEQVVFEAIGGNTILASRCINLDIPLFCSVANTRTVLSADQSANPLQRADLKSIVESMAGCEVSELGDVVKLFSSAKSVEHMSDHIDVTSSGELFAQLRLRTKADDQDQFSGPQVMAYDHARWGKNPDFGIWTIKNRDAGHLRDGSADGKLFCLTFEFKDNPHGYRDFVRDARGFRNPSDGTDEDDDLIVQIMDTAVATGIQATACNPQLQCPLFSTLPGEIRNEIFALALVQYEDSENAYPEDSYWYRPGFSGPRKSSSALLQTCKAAYFEGQKAFLRELEWAFWFDRGPEGRTGMNSCLSFFRKLTPQQSQDLKKVRFFMQMFRFENGTELHRLFHQPNFNPEKLTITIRYSDWWYWESDTPLRMKEDWLRRFSGPPGLRELKVEYETITRKKDAMMKIVERNKKWKLSVGYLEEGGHLSAEGTKLVEWRWHGKSALGGTKWYHHGDGDTMEYVVVTDTWRYVPGPMSEEDLKKREILPPEHYPAQDSDDSDRSDEEEEDDDADYSEYEIEDDDL